jgi:hypothetical protein
VGRPQLGRGRDRDTHHDPRPVDNDDLKRLHAARATQSAVAAVVGAIATVLGSDAAVLGAAATVGACVCANPGPATGSAGSTGAVEQAGSPLPICHRPGTLPSASVRVVRGQSAEEDDR